MAYSLPTFNLNVFAWHFGSAIPGPPDVLTLGNLALGRRISFPTGIPGDLTPSSVSMFLLVPKLTDIRGTENAAGPDTVEVPSGSGRFYKAYFVDDIGKGFANEHRFAMLQQLPPWPSPIP